MSETVRGLFERFAALLLNVASTGGTDDLSLEQQMATTLVIMRATQDIDRIINDNNCRIETNEEMSHGIN